MLSANPFKSQTLAPMDILTQYSGWQNTHISLKKIHGERSDVLDAKLPIWISAKNDLYHGEIPLWNHQRAGKPGLTFSNALFTPAFWVFALVKNDALGFYLSNVVNVLIGLFGMYFFLRLFFGQLSSVFGAFIFMFSGFNTAWFYWAHVNTAIWTPWVFLFVYRYISTQENRYLPLVTLSMLMLNLGGFPMIAVMTYMATAIMVFTYIFSKKLSLAMAMKIILILAFFGMVSVLIALPFIYPLTELLDWMGGMSHRHAGLGFSLDAFWLFVQPDFYRRPRVEATFYVGILPLILFFVALYFYRKKPQVIVTFAFILFFYALIIAFTLISPEIIHQIPTLNSSLLTRFSYLIDVSLAMIAAYAMDQLFINFGHKRWGIIFIAMLFVIQILDQKHLFKQFNAPVPNKAFYPPTETLSYLQKNMRPLQYVLADVSFFLPGTLGGYKLNDWYAHSFHSEEEKKILKKIVKKPFSTPTGARFTCDQIYFKSPYIDFLNIKSILCGKALLVDTDVHLWDNGRSRQALPPLPITKWRQPFHIEKAMQTTGIKLQMATYGKKYAPSDVKLTLFQNHTVIATSVVDKKAITDNAWVPFMFQTPLTLVPGEYSIIVEMLDKNHTNYVTVWANIGEQEYPTEVNENIDTNLAMRMVLSTTVNPYHKYEIHQLEPNIYLWNNLDVKGEAYFLETLSMEQKVNYDSIVTKALSNTQTEIVYHGDKKGFIVLPMRNYPGWVATINGKVAKIQPFLGMLPAVKVDGRCKIRMTYNPAYNKYTYLLSILGIGMLLLSMMKFRRKGVV